jgi:hypothetical protein
MNRKVSLGLLGVAIGVLFIGSCTNHRKEWAAQVDSLKIQNFGMIKSVNQLSLRESLKTIKVESGSRLILLDRYQGSMPIDSQVSPFVSYAKVHKEAQQVDDRLDALAIALQKRTDALKNLRTDIESGAWKKDSVFQFINREKANDKTLRIELEKAMEKTYDLKVQFDSLHPFIVRYTDSILNVRL